MWIKLLLIGALSFDQVVASLPFGETKTEAKANNLFKEEFLNHPYFSEKLHGEIYLNSLQWAGGNQMPAIGGTHFKYY